MPTQAFFLAMGSGARFCLLRRPTETSAERGTVMFIHPFAEELNKSRRMVTLQAQALADAGWSVLQIDLYGCGDSTGDFGEATWQRWVDDVLEAVEWVRRGTGHSPMLWGLRAGCLLVTAAAHRMHSVTDLVLWQPTISGKQVLQQFLRLKLANQIVGAVEGQRIGTQQLRDQLGRGLSIEIAGYTLSPALALGLEAAELEVPATLGRVAWLELTGPAGGEMSPVARARIESWQGMGPRVDARAVAGPAFWQTQEITECPALIEATLTVVQGWGDGRG